MAWLWFTNFLNKEEILELVLTIMQEKITPLERKDHLKVISLQRTKKYLSWKNAEILLNGC